MPPILLLKTDKNFYSDPFKETATGNPDDLKNVAPKPDTMSNVKLSNKIQREKVTDRLTENIHDPDSRENPEFTGELVKKDVEKLKDADDLGSRFVKFLREPIVQVSDETKKQQEKREVARITGDESQAPAQNMLRPVGEVPMELGKRVVDFIEKEFLKVILLVGGLYIAGQAVQGFTKSVGSSRTKKGDLNVSD
tara:strand:- start:565 stop:1149 length:585 start_codon:yes stop_codon:yes gene_type:complete